MFSYSSSIADNSTITRPIINSRSIGIIAFTFLTILGSKVEIPIYPVPFTLQTLFIFLSGAFLGKRDGAISQLFYLALGVIGLPVFAGPVAGFMKLIGPTGGYLIAFPVAAFVTGWLLEINTGLVKQLLAMITGAIIIYLFGVIHLNTFYLHNIKESILSGLAVFSFWEMVKITAAAFVYNNLKK